MSDDYRGLREEGMEWCDLTWAHVNHWPAPRNTQLWVKTASGIVAIGWTDGAMWRTDGFRVSSMYDSVVWWTEINYPEGPK